MFLSLGKLKLFILSKFSKLEFLAMNSVHVKYSFLGQKSFLEFEKCTPARLATNHTTNSPGFTGKIKKIPPAARSTQIA